MFTKLAIFCAVLAAVSAGLIHGGGLGGTSVSSRRQDDFGNYAFNYQITNGVGATNGRAEVGDAWGNKRGSYNLADIDGRARRVEYVADGAGFRAVVKTNEPGTALSAPAAAAVVSPHTGPISGTPAVVAHAPVAAIAAAPITAAVAPAVAAAPIAAHAGIVGAPLAAAGLGFAHGGIVGAPLAAAGLGIAHGGIVGAPLAAAGLGFAHGGIVGAPLAAAGLGIAHGGFVGAPIAAGIAKGHIW